MRVSANCIPTLSRRERERKREREKERERERESCKIFDELHTKADIVEV